MWLIAINSFSQNYTFSGRIAHDTVWQADTIFITNHVTIDTGIRLTIMPGTVILFEGYYHLLTYGYIRAQGSSNDSVVFMKTDTTGLLDATTYEGGWNGIRLMPRTTSDTSMFYFCRFEAGKAVVPSTPHYDDSDDNKGGLIYCSTCGNVFLENSLIRNSFAKRDGAGLYAYGAKKIIVSNCKFSANYARYQGGAIYSHRTNILTIENNLFVRNTSFYQYIEGGILTTLGQGAGVSALSPLNPHDTCRLIGNRFFNNFSAFGTMEESYRKTIIESNMICNNEGVSILNAHSFSAPEYRNNTIMNNHNLYYVAGLLYNTPSLKLVNNIIWHNYTLYPGDPQIFSKDNYTIDVTYSNIMYGYEGEGNINEVPMFVRPTIAVGDGYDGLDADWSLLDESPCVNTGIADTSGLNLSPLDLLGNPRVFGGRIDMGAIENQNVLLNEVPLVAAQIQVYPNPGNDRLFIVVPVGFESGTFELFDAQGVCVISQQVAEGPVAFLPARATPGIYFYRLRQNNHIVAQGKWIKTN